jgi:hypothetical protein
VSGFPSREGKVGLRLCPVHSRPGRRSVHRSDSSTLSKAVGNEDPDVLIRLSVLASGTQRAAPVWANPLKWSRKATISCSFIPDFFKYPGEDAIITINALNSINIMKPKPNLVAAGLFLAALGTGFGQPTLQFSASTYTVVESAGAETES